MYRKEIIKAFQDAPQTWTDSQLASLETATGEKITRADLETAHRQENSINGRAAAAMIAECYHAISGADFETRLQIVTRQLLPALAFQDAQKARDAAPVATAENGTGGAPTA